SLGHRRSRLAGEIAADDRGACAALVVGPCDPCSAQCANVGGARDSGRYSHSPRPQEEAADRLRPGLMVFPGPCETPGKTSVAYGGVQWLAKITAALARDPPVACSPTG